LTIKTIIVDDEELARRGLRTLLRTADDIEIVAECRNGREACDAIMRIEPDLVFLDIQMPGKTGFEVIAQLHEGRCPHVIFVTAFDKFALKAFEVHALDYLLKPINEERFNTALARARAALSSVRDDALIRRILQMAADVRPSGAPSGAAPVIDRLPIKTNGKWIGVRLADIDWIEADHDYVVLHVGEKRWLLRETIASVEARLAVSQFVRVHRSALVNVDRVQELRPCSKGEFIVVLLNGTELKMTRSYRAAVERLVGLGSSGAAPKLT
jgi:two-component system, LytTR family, response regulator